MLKLTRTIVVLMLLSFSFGHAVLAQGEPFPPTTQIFESGAKVLAAEPITNPIDPIIRWDDKSHEVVILLGNNDHAIHYPYPDAPDKFYSMGGVIGFWHDLIILSGYTETTEFKAFFLNPETGSFVMYKPQCGPQSLEYLDLNFRNGSGFWMLASDVNGFSLCATITGQRIPIKLPSDFAPSPDFFRPKFLAPSLLTPDSSHLIFLSAAGDIYSYAFEGGEVLHIGVVPSYTKLNDIEGGWVDHGKLELDMHTQQGCAKYITDVSSADQPPLITDYSEYCGSVKTGPLRIVVDDEISQTNSQQRLTCTREIYDFATRKKQSYEYGDLCFPEYNRDDIVGYNRTATEKPDTVNIVRFDPRTSEQKILFKGAGIENIVWVSEGEHYAVLLTDESPNITLPPDGSGNWADILNPSLALVDLHTDTILYTTPIPWQYVYDDYTVYSTFTPLHDNLWLFQPRDPYSPGDLIVGADIRLLAAYNLDAQLVRMNDGQAEITDVGKVAAILSDHKLLLIWSGGHQTFLNMEDSSFGWMFNYPCDEIAYQTAGYDLGMGTITAQEYDDILDSTQPCKKTVNGLAVYDVDTGKTTPLVRPIDPALYSVNVTVSDKSNMAFITIYRIIDGIVDKRSGMRYTVQF